jgi:hypothetical protein
MGVMLATLSTTAAGARVLERERYSGTDSRTETICGHRFNVESTFSGLFMWKTRGNQLTPYLSDNGRFRNVYTDADGDGFIIQGNALFKVVRIRHVRGTLYRHIAHESGQPFSIRALDGTVVLRDRGLLKTSFLIDTKGDQNLENDVFLDRSFRLLKDAGRHPGFYLEGEEFCALIEEAMRS